MAKGIIDTLKVVNIKNDKRKTTTLSLCALEKVGKRRIKRSTIFAVCECVATVIHSVLDAPASYSEAIPGIIAFGPNQIRPFPHGIPIGEAKTEAEHVFYRRPDVV